MRQQKAVLFLCICLNLLSFAGRAQRNYGVATSDWSSLNSLYLNPANIAGSHEKITISLFSLGLGVDNNLGKFTSIGNIGNALKSNDSGGNSLFQNSGRKDFSMIAPSAEIRGPGILVKINDRQSIALTTRIRVINQFNNFDQSLYNTVTNTTFAAGNNYAVSAKNFNWTAHLWSEVGITYGVVLIDGDNSQLKGGITLRYLGGIGYLSLKGNNLDLNYSSGKDSFYASNSDLQYSSNIISSQSALFNGVSSSDLLGNFFGSKQGGGLGTDLGVVYAFNPGGSNDEYDDNGGKNKTYKLKLSVAITDIGSINYKQQYNSTVNVTGNGYITGTGLSANVKNATDFRNYLVSQGFTGDTAAKATRIYLPTALLVGADYRVYKNFCLNATYFNNLAGRQNFGNSYYNQITVTPRYDTKLMAIGLPITYSMLANDVKMGLGFRVGGFFMGSDDMLALVSKGQYGFNFYLGGYIPLYSKQTNIL